MPPSRPWPLIAPRLARAAAMTVLLGGCASTSPGVSGDSTTGSPTTGGSGALPDAGATGEDGTTGSASGTSVTSATSGTSSTTTGAGTGGTTDIDPDACAVIRREAPEAKGGVDVVFVLDTSGSMLHAISQVTQNLASFIQEFESTPADTRVVMITGNDPAAGSAVAGDASRYRFIASEVDSQALFSVALDRFGQYQDFLRPNAAVQFVMITDDDDRIAPADFRAQMEGLLGRPFTQHAIASEDVMGAPCTSEIGAMNNPLCVTIPGLGGIPALCTAAAIGRAYYGLAAETGGETMSICKGDWSDVFAQLKSAVVEAAPLPCDYPLDAASDPNFDPGQVKIVYTSGAGEQEFPKADTADACADHVAWFYDDPIDPGTISLCPAACDTIKQGGSVDIAFGCPPITIY